MDNPNKVKVFVGQPVYRGAEAEAVLGATALASKVPDLVQYKCLRSPFHCHNFNSLWCVARNSRKERGYTHFAMLHHDIKPEVNWIDKSLEIMRREGVDLLSIVVPLKDEHGLTSTAALNQKTLSTRRLTMTEVFDYLPPTFTSDDLSKLGYKDYLLLHGSGMWVCDFTKDWVKKVWFEAPTRIIELVDGTCMAVVWDEGWNFSLQLYQLGLKIACTREIASQHLGDGVFGNDEAWGTWATDCSEMNQKWILGSCDDSNGKPRGSLPTTKPEVILG